MLCSNSENKIARERHGQALLNLSDVDLETFFNLNSATVPLIWGFQQIAFLIGLQIQEPGFSECSNSRHNPHHHLNPSLRDLGPSDSSHLQWVS
jgi:hypothetical protein